MNWPPGAGATEEVGLVRQDKFLRFALFLFLLHFYGPSAHRGLRRAIIEELQKKVWSMSRSFVRDVRCCAVS